MDIGFVELLILVTAGINFGTIMAFVGKMTIRHVPDPLPLTEAIESQLKTLFSWSYARTMRKKYRRYTLPHLTVAIILLLVTYVLGGGEIYGFSYLSEFLVADIVPLVLSFIVIVLLAIFILALPSVVLVSVENMVGKASVVQLVLSYAWGVILIFFIPLVFAILLPENQRQIIIVWVTYGIARVLFGLVFTQLIVDEKQFLRVLVPVWVIVTPLTAFLAGAW